MRWVWVYHATRGRMHVIVCSGSPPGLNNAIGVPVPLPLVLLAHHSHRTTLPTTVPPSASYAGSFKDYSRGQGRLYHCPRCSEVRRHQTLQLQAQAMVATQVCSTAVVLLLSCFCPAALMVVYLC